MRFMREGMVTHHGSLSKDLTSTAVTHHGSLGPNMVSHHGSLFGRISKEYPSLDEGVLAPLKNKNK